MNYLSLVSSKKKYSSKPVRHEEQKVSTSQPETLTPQRLSPAVERIIEYNIAEQKREYWRWREYHDRFIMNCF